MKLYDKNAVAKFLDMTPKNVERLTQKGILQTKQGNLYALAETNRAYIKYLRDRNPESQEAVDLNEERAKLTKTKRLNEELDLAVKKGELHRSEDIEKVMTAMLINFKSRLSAIPAEEADKLAAMTEESWHLTRGCSTICCRMRKIQKRQPVWRKPMRYGKIPKSRSQRS